MKQTVVSVNGKKVSKKIDKAKYGGYKNPPILFPVVSAINSPHYSRDVKHHKEIKIMANFNFSRPASFNTSNGVSPFSAVTGASAASNSQGGDFESQCGEGEHILAIQLNAAKHWQMQQGGGYKSLNGTRESTYLTFTAGSVMVSQQNGPFAKGLLLVGLYLYKKGVYLQPPAYTSDSAGNWGIHPEASLSGLAKLVYGDFAEETSKLMALYSSKIDEIVSESRLAENAPQLIEEVEGCILSGDFTGLEAKGVTAENVKEYIQWVTQKQVEFENNKVSLQEEYEHCTTQCQQLVELRKDTQFWRYLCENTQSSINLTGLSNDNIINCFESLKEDTKGEGRILKMRCIISTSIGASAAGPTIEVKIQALACKIEKGQLGKAVIGTRVTQTDSTRKLAAADNLLQEQAKERQFQEASMKMAAWTNTAQYGNKSMQSFQEFKQSTQGGHPQTKKTNQKKVEKRATQKEQELVDAIALLRKVAPSSPEIANLEAQLASVQARIASLQERTNQQEAAASIEEEVAEIQEISTTEQETLPQFTGNELDVDANF